MQRNTDYWGEGGANMLMSLVLIVFFLSFEIVRKTSDYMGGIHSKTHTLVVIQQV